MKKEVEWWMEEGGLFGTYYMEGDNANVDHGRNITLEQRTAMEVDGIMYLLQLKPGMKILDLPCGYGRHSNALSAQGISVVGGDINSVHLNYAVAQAKKAKLKTDFRKMNMLDVGFKNEFDALINMYYSFGFFKTDAENNRVLKNFYNALKPDGKFLMHTDVNVARIINDKDKNEDMRTLVSGNRLWMAEKYNPQTKRMDGIWRIIKPDGQTEEVPYSVRVYTKDEFTKMCKETGFKKVEVYSDWKGAAYRPDSLDMMVIAEK